MLATKEEIDGMTRAEKLRALAWLRESLGTAGTAAPGPAKKRDLSWLAGSWNVEEARAFDEAVAECRRVEPSDWT